jgi:DNA-binding transcriptional MerR regulator
MPYLHKDIEKVYYSIKEVANILECSTSKIRFYEGEFPWTAPKKGRSGHRQYNRKEVKELVNIFYLMEQGFTSHGIRLAKENDYLDDLLNFFMDINFNYGVHISKRL